jgi:superfamily II DNA helicase RecQ
MVDLRGYNILSLYQCAKDIGMPFSILRPLISFWSSYKNEQVPPHIQKELNLQPISPMPSGYGPYSPYGFMEQPQKREDLDLFDRLIKWESLKMQSQQQTIAQPNLENQYQQQIETLRLELQKAQENYRAEVEKLKEELRRKEQERLEERLRSLEERLRSYERPSGDYKDDSIRLLAEAIKEIGKKEPLDKIKELLPQILSAAYGIPQEKLQQQPPQARLGLMELLRQRGLTVPQ